MGKQLPSQRKKASDLPSKEILKLVSQDPDMERHPFLLYLQRENNDVLLGEDISRRLPTLLQQILSDIASGDEETAALALRYLGYVVHHDEIVTVISDETASSIFQSLSQLIISTDRKALCNLAVWCLGIQEFQASLLDSHIDSFLQAIVHAIDNPMGSMAITYEALQAVVKMVQKVPKMRVLSSVWAPPVYRRLLSADRRDRDIAERCIKEVESTLLPPLSSLSKVVLIDIKQTLLSKMEKMVRSHTLIVPTIRAWGRLVQLLGGQAGENRILLNQMLKIAEVTFTSHDTQVQIASLVAWEALIDALLQYQHAPGPQADCNQLEAANISPPPGGNQNSPASPSLKRLKLLMMPLITIMSGDQDPSVRLACWRTWTYLAHKLGFVINHSSVLTVVVAPMFKVVLKSGPLKAGSWVWDLCLNAFKELLASKIQNKSSSCLSQFLHIGIGGRVSSPKTPTCNGSGNESDGSLLIQWAPWSLESLDSLLEFVRILWRCGVDDLKNSCDTHLSLNGAVRMWLLVVKGVECEGKGAVKPSQEHVGSVHLLLKFLNEITRKDEIIVSSKELVSAVWSVVEVLMELHPLVLSSSFYKLPLTFEGIQDKDDNSHNPVNTIDSAGGKQIGIGSSLEGVVTPIVYITAVWCRFICIIASNAGEDGGLTRLSCNIASTAGEEESGRKSLEKLALTACAGLGIMGNLQGIALVIELLLSDSMCTGAGVDLLVNSLKTQPHCTNSEEPKYQRRGIYTYYLLQVWKIFAEHMAKYLENANEVPAIGGGIGDSGYQVVHNFLLLPLRCGLQVTCPCFGSKDKPGGHPTSKDTGDGELECVTATWIKLFDCSSRISSLRSSQPNFFVSGLCQRILKIFEHRWQETPGKIETTANQSCFLTELIGVIVTNVLRQTQISSLAMLAINRKKRLGSFMSVTYIAHGPLGYEVDDSSNIKDILSLASRFLDLLWDAFMAGRAWWLVSASRVMVAMTSFLARLYSQHDLLLFLQDLSKPFAKWLGSFESILNNYSTHNSSSVLLQALEKIWVRLLSCLQKCQPPLTYDSGLLALQAPLLVVAFKHSSNLILNCTLSFWEATYGSKALTLNYPPCLVPVLCQLKEKVRISLPGWEKGSDKMLEGRLQHVLPSGSASHKYVGGWRRRNMLQEEFLDKRSVSICRPPTNDRKDKLHQMNTLFKPGSASFPETAAGVTPGLADKPVDVLLERIKRPVGNAELTPVGLEGNMDSLQSEINASKNAPPSSSDTFALMKGEQSSCQLVPGRMNTEVALLKGGQTTTLREDHSAADLRLVNDRKHREVTSRACKNVNTRGAVTEGMPSGSVNLPSIDPGNKLASMNNSENTLVMDSKTEKNFVQNTTPDTGTVPELDLGAPARRKKLKFLDDESVEYASIPLSQKKSGPLTEHQKEVRLAQQGVRVGCTGHGTGIKTYTNVDFSQSQVALDSEDPEDAALQMFCPTFNKEAEAMQNATKGISVPEMQAKENPRVLHNAGRSVDIAMSECEGKNAVDIMGHYKVDKETSSMGEGLSVLKSTRYFSPNQAFDTVVDQSLDANTHRAGKMLTVTSSSQTQIMRARMLNRSSWFLHRKGEVKKLDIRQRRFLRSSGCLRGGKDWRISSEAAKGLPTKLGKRSRQQSFGLAKDCHVAERKSDPEVIKGEGFSEQTQIFCKEEVHVGLSVSSPSKASSKDSKLSRQVVADSPFRVQNLNRGFLSKIFSPFAKVSERDQSGVSCIRTDAELKETKPVLRARSHHRKSSFPKRIHFAKDALVEQIAGMQLQGSELKQVKVVNAWEKKGKLGSSKKAEIQFRFKPGTGILRSMTPSKTLRSGRKLKSIKQVANATDIGVNQRLDKPACNRTGLTMASRVLGADCQNREVSSGVDIQRGSFNALGETFADARDCEGCQVSKGDAQPVTSAYKEKSCVADMQSRDSLATMAPHGSSCSSLITKTTQKESQSKKELQEVIGAEWSFCDLLSAMVSSSQWRSMELDDLGHAEKLLSALQDVVLERKKRLTDRQSHAECKIMTLSTT